MQAYKLNAQAMHMQSPKAMITGVWFGLKVWAARELTLTALLSRYQSPQLTFMQSQRIYEEEVHDPKHYPFYFKH